jgi:hypothetical protein
MMSRNVEIDFGEDDDSSTNFSSASNELEEYLISQNKKSQNNNSVSAFFSNVGSGIQKVLPKRVGGTGNVENDIAVRFGNLFGSSSSVNDGSGVSSQQTTSAAGGWCSFTLVIKREFMEVALF